MSTRRRYTGRSRPRSRRGSRRVGAPADGACGAAHRCGTCASRTFEDHRCERRARFDGAPTRHAARFRHDARDWVIANGAPAHARRGGTSARALRTFPPRSPFSNSRDSTTRRRVGPRRGSSPQRSTGTFHVMAPHQLGSNRPWSGDCHNRTPDRDVTARAVAWLTRAAVRSTARTTAGDSLRSRLHVALGTSSALGYSGATCSPEGNRPHMFARSRAPFASSMPCFVAEARWRCPSRRDCGFATEHPSRS